MKKLVTFAILIAIASASGCSFVMKEYDARNERKIAELDKENKALTSKVRTLERKVPELDKHLKELESDNKKLRTDLSTIDTKIATIDVEKIESMELDEAQPAPAPEPALEEEEPFAISETPDKPEEDPNKPEVQAPKSQLTPAAAKIMEMAKKKEGASDADGSAANETVTVPTPEPAAKPEPPAEEAGSKSKLTPDAERIMALAKQKAGIEEPSKPAPTPEPKPEPTANVKTKAEPDSQKSALTPEAERILAMARGEEPEPAEAKPQKTAKAQPAPGTAKQAPVKSVKLKVLGGTGSIVEAKKMAKTLEGLGYKTKQVALAPRSNFDRNTVYYAKGHESTAEELKKKLGGKTITKALSWKSEFDIIVVSAE